jgi:cyclopropane-fatty-acyl-phospholipid synthase
LDGVLNAVLGEKLTIGVRAFDGTVLGPPHPPATLVLRSVDALRRIFWAPSELGFARAYVAGDLDVEGDLLAALSFGMQGGPPKLTARDRLEVARLVGRAGLRPLPPPPEEARLRGRTHSTRRDAQAVAHHYDLSNEVYRLMLGPSMTYSCAVFADEQASLEAAQAAKIELICRKLGLHEGTRLLDVGCGWGALAIHAAVHHGATVVGVTPSMAQVELARKLVAEAGVADRVDIRPAHYRDVHDGPFDAIASVGMFEHVGPRESPAFLKQVFDLLAPGGRYLQHAINRPPFRRPLYQPPTFISRYIFPDGDLLELGTVVSMVQQAGFEARHVESLRDHYGPTLRCWLANLEAHWDEIVSEIGARRARVWRLYLAVCALNFEANGLHVNQVLAVRPAGGRSHMPLRPTWEQTSPEPAFA